MMQVGLYAISWVVLTMMYLIWSDSAPAWVRADQLAALYFVLSTLPGALLYRFSSFRALNKLIEKKIIASSLQLRILGTISLVFLHALFFGKSWSDRKEQILLRLELIAESVFFGMSVVVINLDNRIMVSDEPRFDIEIGPVEESCIPHTPGACDDWYRRQERKHGAPEQQSDGSKQLPGGLPALR
jgi:hypothetical protein